MVVSHLAMSLAGCCRGKGRTSTGLGTCPPHPRAESPMGKPWPPLLCPQSGNPTQPESFSLDFTVTLVVSSCVLKPSSQLGCTGTVVTRTGTRTLQRHARPHKHPNTEAHGLHPTLAIAPANQAFPQSAAWQPGVYYKGQAPPTAHAHTAQPPPQGLGQLGSPSGVG